MENRDSELQFEISIMQGTLKEIDMRSLLQLITLGQQTGGLLVEACSPASVRFSDPPSPSWYVFFVNGHIVYTVHKHFPPLNRLQDYLRHYGISTLPDQSLATEMAKINELEYSYIWLLLKEKTIKPEQARAIIDKMVQETLFDLFNLYNGSFQFKQGVEWTPQLTYVAIAPLIPRMVQQIEKWQQFYPHIRSSEQCLTLRNPTALQTNLSPRIYHSLVHWADGKTSLRQLSRYLNRNLVTLAKGIYPYLERGWLRLTPSDVASIANPIAEKLVASDTDFGLKIICIGDDPTMDQTLENLLADSNHQLTFLNNPLQALSQLFELDPDIILCDVTMPQLDGYEICRMLRQSCAFSHTPIILLTENEQFPNRVRASMAGANGYLTKSFTENELLSLLEQYALPQSPLPSEN